jgi:hypothetical protein
VTWIAAAAVAMGPEGFEPLARANRNRPGFRSGRRAGDEGAAGRAWLQLGTVQQIRFGRDGRFGMDYNLGDLDHPSTAAGTYELRGGTIGFLTDEPGLFCFEGDEWTWNVVARKGELPATWVEDWCTVQSGTRWTLQPIHR